MSWAAAFAALVLLDWLYADYTRHVAAGHVWSSASLAAALYGCTGLATLAVVKDPTSLPAAMAGAFVGTALAQLRARRGIMPHQSAA